MRSKALKFFSVTLLSILCGLQCFAAGKPNIVLITLESARADRMGFLGSRAGLTHTIDGVAAQGLVFSQAYSQSPLTVASTATILTGTYPQTHGASELGAPLNSSLPYLPDLLHGRGYRTAAFVGSILLDPKNGPFQNYDRGFDSYDAGFHQAKKGEGRLQSIERPGDQVATRAAKWIEENAKNSFFVWVQLPDAHAPSATYNRGITAEDAAAGKVMAALRAQKLYDDALVVIAADHGESLGAHGEETHGFFLYDDTILVPLLIKLPQNAQAGKRVKNRVRLLDVAPTILESAGIPVPSQMQGQSLLRVAQGSSQSDPPAYSRTDFPQQGFGAAAMESWRAGKYLYIRAPKAELYDISADPAGAHNLAQSSKATADTLASQIQSFDNRFSQGGSAGNSGLTSSEMQKLASLGYVGLQKQGGAQTAAVTGTDPKDIIGNANKAIAAMSAIEDGKPERAIAVLQPLVKAQPEFYLPQFAMGMALVQQQQYAKAIPFLRKAIGLQPQSGFAHYEMGVSLMKTNDFKSAAVHLEIASGRLPNFAELHSALAEAYTHLGRNDDASRERTRASQLTKS